MSFAAVIAELRTLTNPYPGLRPFETWESHLFFGRDQQVAELVARLERDRFLAVVGVSGSGKSSLVRAGLLPALERGRVLEAGRRWRMVVTRPGGAPLAGLSADLAHAGLDASPLTHSSHGLIEVARGLSSDESLLVLVDQFEELFRYKDLPASTEDARLRRGASASEAAEFVQVLLEATRHARPVYVILTMRSDYLGDCAEFRDLPEALNDCQYLVPRLTRAQRKEAIEVPLGTVGIAPSLVQRLLNDAGDAPDQLPVLQHALMRTWAHWRAADPEQTRRIELADYESIGGFENAIDLHAEEVLVRVSDEAFAEKIFKRLTAIGRGNRERRDPATFDELCAVCGATAPEVRARVKAVVDAFRSGDATFLTPRVGDLAGADPVDIMHESLIRQWRRLRDLWLPAEQQSAKTFLTLVERARNWGDGKAEPFAGLDLADAREWDRGRNPTVAWAEHYAEAKNLEQVLRFIGASRAHDRKLRLRKRGLWVAGPLAVVFAFLGILAGWQAVKAARLSEESRAGKLLARSQLLMTTDANPTPSVLLALEALRRLPNADAEQALRHAVARVPRQLFHVPLAAAPRRESAQSDENRRDRIVISADGRSMAVVTADNVDVVDVQTGRRIATMKAPSTVLDVAPGTTGTWVVATAGADESPRLISFPDGREIQRLTPHGSITAMALSRDGRYAATVTEGGWCLHDLKDGREVALPPVTNPIAATFSPDGARIAVGTADPIPGQPGYGVESGRGDFSHSAVVFDTVTRSSISYKLAGEVRALTFSRNGRFLVTAGQDGAARVFDLNNGSEPARMSTGTPLVSVAISDDARVVATGGADGASRAFETDSGSEIVRVIHECPATADGAAPLTPSGAASCRARSVAVSGDGRVVFSAGDDGILRAFETLGATDAARITESLPVTAVALTRDGRRLAIGSGDIEGANLRVFDYPEWRERRFKPSTPEVRSVAFSANGRFVALASNWAEGPWIFDINEPEMAPRALRGPSLMSSVTLSGDGSVVAWIAGLKVMRFDLISGKAIPLLGIPTPQAIALSDDGRTAAVATASLGVVSAVIVARFSDGTTSTSVPFRELIQSVAISGDGRWVAASGGVQSLDGLVHVIDATVGRERWQHIGARNTPVAFSRDGTTTAMASADGTLRTFDTSTGQETFRTALEQPIAGLAFDERGRALLAASVTRTIAQESGFTVKRYLLRRDDLIAHACSRVARSLTKPEWERYVGPDVPHNMTCGAQR